MHKELLSKAVLADKYLFMGVVSPEGGVEVLVTNTENYRMVNYAYDNGAQAQAGATGDNPVETQVAATIALDLFTEASAQWEAQR